MRISWNELNERGLVDRVLSANKDVLVPSSIAKHIKIEEKRKELIVKNSNTDSDNHPQKILLKSIVEKFKNIVIEVDFKKAVPGRRFEIDIALMDYQIAIEVDGFRSHGISKVGWLRDRKKDRLLQLNGWVVLRFSAGEVFKDLENVILEIERFVSKR
jgi:very-short-patch-repair endonuclease